MRASESFGRLFASSRSHHLLETRKVSNAAYFSDLESGLLNDRWNNLNSNKRATGKLNTPTLRFRQVVAVAFLD